MRLTFRLKVRGWNDTIAPSYVRGFSQASCAIPKFVNPILKDNPNIIATTDEDFSRLLEIESEKFLEKLNTQVFIGFVCEGEKTLLKTSLVLSVDEFRLEREPDDEST